MNGFFVVFWTRPFLSPQQVVEYFVAIFTKGLAASYGKRIFKAKEKQIRIAL